MKDAPSIFTDRLILRPWRYDDFNPVAEMMADPVVARFTSLDRRPQSRDQSWRTLAQMAGQWALQGFGMFAVEERESGAFVGRVGAWRPEGWTAFEIGWGLAPGAWGKGYATEAALAAGYWTFEKFDPPEILSLIHADNLKSQNVAMRLGQRPRSATIHAGELHTVWVADKAAWGVAASAS